MSDLSKPALRREIFARMRALSDREHRSRTVFGRLFELNEYQQAESVLLYAHIGCEVQTTDAMNRVWADGKQLVLPRCEGKNLVLYKIESVDELEPGSFGIPEPISAVLSDPRRRLDATAIDLLCIPGVAFDRAGNRLGRGKGFYDRLLATCSADANLFGVAFDCQIVESVPTLPHDRPMTAVLSESGVQNR